MCALTCHLLTHIHLSVEIQLFYFNSLLTELIDYGWLRTCKIFFERSGQKIILRRVPSVGSPGELVNRGVFQQNFRSNHWNRSDHVNISVNLFPTFCRWDNNFSFRSNACTVMADRMRSERKPLLLISHQKGSQDGSWTWMLLYEPLQVFDSLSHWTQIGRVGSLMRQK